MTLRSRLTLVTVALFAVGLVVMAAVTFVLVRAFLVDRVDEQLASKALPGAEKVFEAPGFAEKKLDQPTDGLLYSELVITVLDDRGRTVDRWPATETLPELPADLPGSAQRPDAVTLSASIGSNATHYRITARPRVDAPGTLVVALPLTDVDSTLQRLVLIEALVGTFVLLGLAVLTRAVLGAGLRPLVQIAGTADDIAAGDLSHRVDAGSGGTEVARVGSAFNQMLDRLEVSFQQQRASEELLRRFVADVSHELRTPLTSIRGYAELTRRLGSSEDDARRQALARIEEEAVRMSALVEDLLLLARLDQGRGHASEQVDLAGLTRDVVETARELDPDRRLEVTTNGAAIVEGDPDRLRQVLTNLVANVRAHTPPGTPASVHVACVNGFVRVDVHDEGPGIAASAQPHIFERFYRADAARARATGGSGLGLSIVKSIVDSHGGDVRVRSVHGEGTTVTVKLSAVTHPAADQSNAAFPRRQQRPRRQAAP